MILSGTGGVLITSSDISILCIVVINPFSSPAGVAKDPTDPFGMATFSPTSYTPEQSFSQPGNDFSDLQVGNDRNKAV